MAVAMAAASLMGTVALAGCGDGGSASTAERPTGPRHGPSIVATIDEALFTVDCEFSHRLPDDPIVHPGEPGASHMHDFFGAEGTDAHSTARSLRGGPTTCEDKEDTASYWAPTLYVHTDDGTEPLEPQVLRAYYRAAVGADAREVRPPPPGIQLLAGDSHAAEGAWTPTSIAGWGCGMRPKHLFHRPPDDCTPSSPVTLRLVFPDCWDGRHVASDDHVSHVARSTDGRCPESHPVPILQVQLSISYPVWGEGGAGSPAPDDLVLASGRWETTHGDFFNAWDQARLRHQTELCIRSMANCTIG